MNDVIMASVAALKSRSEGPQFSLYTGFRSVRGQKEPLKQPAVVDAPVKIALDRQTKAFFDRHSDNPQNHMLKVLQDHARRHDVPSKG